MPEQQHALHFAYQLIHQEKFEQAKACFQDLLHGSSTESRAFAFNGLALCETSQNNLKSAETYFLKALELLPQESEIINNLAICLHEQGRIRDSLKYFEQLSDLSPSFQTHFNYATAARACSENERAFYAYAEALKWNPADGYCLLFLAQLGKNLYQKPPFFERFKIALDEDPEHPVLNLCAVFLYLFESNYIYAQKHLKLALMFEPGLYESFSLMFPALQAKGAHEEALLLAKMLFFYEPSYRSLSEVIAACQKGIYQNRQELEQLRAELYKMLEIFDSDIEISLHRPFIRPSVMNFYHTYQGYEDRELQEKIANSFTRVIPVRKFEFRTNTPPRIGFVSLHFWDHSVMHLLQAAVEHLMTAAGFETYLFLMPEQGFKHDAVTERLKSCADHVVSLRGQHAKDIQTIESKHLDLLIYLDIGMDSVTYFFALYRLARFQIALTGHPVTTGLPEMDFFISSQDLELPHAEQHYSEQLVRLKGLPDYAPPIKPAIASCQSLGLPEGNLYFCPMTIFKMHPDMDIVFQGILEQDPDAQLLFLASGNKHLPLQARFKREFSAAQYARIYFLPWSVQIEFFQRLMACDVILDSFYFGGGNTSYQALGLGCAIVTLDVPWNKGRWTQTMYKLMDIEGLVAQDIEQYVNLAVELACNKQKQKQIRQLISERNFVLFNNPSWSEGLLAFCEQLVQN